MLKIWYNCCSIIWRWTSLILIIRTKWWMRSGWKHWKW